MFLLPLLGAAVHVAVHHDATFLEKVITASQVAGGVAAMSAITVFAWAKLRLDKAWSWVFKHLREDQKAARLKEYTEAQSTPEIRELRRAEFTDAFDEKIVPQLRIINKRIDDHMEREEQALNDSATHVKVIGQNVEKIALEQSRVADELTKSQVKVDAVSEQISVIAEKRDAEAQVVAKHIEDDAEFQARVEPFLTGKSNAKAV